MVFTANHLTDNVKNSLNTENDSEYSKKLLYGSVTSYNTWPGNEMGLFYNTLEPTRVITFS